MTCAASGRKEILRFSGKLHYPDLIERASVVDVDLRPIESFTKVDKDGIYHSSKINKGMIVMDEGSKLRYT